MVPSMWQMPESPEAHLVEFGKSLVKKKKSSIILSNKILEAFLFKSEIRQIANNNQKRKRINV